MKLQKFPSAKFDLHDHVYLRTIKHPNKSSRSCLTFEITSFKPQENNHFTVTFIRYTSWANYSILKE